MIKLPFSAVMFKVFQWLDWVPLMMRGASISDRPCPCSVFNNDQAQLNGVAIEEPLNLSILLCRDVGEV